MNKQIFTPDTYYWLIQKVGENDETALAYYFYNASAELWGFGFNVADGGGFLPEKDLLDTTSVVPITMTENLEFDDTLLRLEALSMVLYQTVEDFKIALGQMATEKEILAANEKLMAIRNEYSKRKAV